MSQDGPVLGLCSFTHDSAAALVTDGRLTGMAEEERLSGVKHTRNYPAQAVSWLLSAAGLAPGDVDMVAYNFAGHRYLAGVAGSARYLVRSATRDRARARAASFAVVHHRYRQRMRYLRQAFPNATVRGFSNHLTHGLYAFAASGYEQAAVLIADSLGETCTTSLGHARAEGCRIRYRVTQTISDPASLGYAYGAVTEHLGWRRGDEEGTVMALAALGDPARFRGVFAQAIRLTRAGFALDPGLLPLRVLRHGWPRVTPAFIEVTCPPRQAGDDVAQVHADVAAALQERTEQVMLHLARRAREVTGSRLLCAGGGVGMNCVAIGKIICEGLFDEVLVPPAPGDAGTAIGAAIVAHLDLTGAIPSGTAHACYLGPCYDDYQPGPAPGLTARRVSDPAGFLAARLAEGTIADLFQGHLEVGPRALGNRSILASPLLPDVTARLNAVASELTRRGVIVSPRVRSTWFSMHFYNSSDDIDRALAALDDVLRSPRPRPAWCGCAVQAGSRGSTGAEPDGLGDLPELIVREKVSLATQRASQAALAEPLAPGGCVMNKDTCFAEDARVRPVEAPSADILLRSPPFRCRGRRSGQNKGGWETRVTWLSSNPLSSTRNCRSGPWS